MASLSEEPQCDLRESAMAKNRGLLVDHWLVVAALVVGMSSVCLARASEDALPLCFTAEGVPNVSSDAQNKEKEPLSIILAKPVDVHFKDTPLKEALEKIRSTYGIAIRIDQVALAKKGISLDRPVTCQLEKVKLKSALTLLLGKFDLAYVVDGDGVEITTVYWARVKPVTRIFPVDDLFAAARPELSRKPQPPLRDDIPRASEWLVGSDELVRLVECTIAPGHWEADGGKGTICYNANARGLVLTQPRDVLDEVQELLAALRRAVEAENRGRNSVVPGEAKDRGKAVEESVPSDPK
jgi:type II secretory pathway component GspD/PulD (secretin)